MTGTDVAVDTTANQTEHASTATTMAAPEASHAPSSGGTTFSSAGAIPPVSSGGLTGKPKPSASDLAFGTQQSHGAFVRGPGDGKDGGVNAATVTPTAGQSGMLTRDLTLKLGGTDTPVPKGTFVEVVTAGPQGLSVKVWSTFGGQQATVPADAVTTEPALSKKDDPAHSTEPEDFTYQPYSNPLWTGTPSAADVAQGQLGDCYLMSAMGAVAAANPQAIMRLFSPQTAGAKTYTVTLYVQDATGKLVPKKTTVDPQLPTQDNTPAYGMMQKDLNDKKTPMWPALLEKAYAQLIGGNGGYERIGGGGFAADAMAAFTGKEAEDQPIAEVAAGVIAQFQALQKSGQAVVCATLDHKDAASKGGFAGTDLGPYSMMLTDDGGAQVELVPGTLKITDSKGKAPVATDDSSGKITGDGVTGSTGYGWGATPNLTYDKDKAPGAAADLKADYEWRGQLDKSIDVYANHAYMFETVTADGKLQFKNPWGTEHPQPMTGDDFKRLFIGITSDDAKPAPAPKPAPGKTTK